MTRKAFILGTVAAVFICVPAAAMDTAFSYQGRLSDAGVPATGDYDFRFLLYTADVGGSQVGPILYGEDTQVIDGYFTIFLDFGAGVFDGTDLWLEVSVRDGASTGNYTPLSPRQSILPSPYSLYSAKITWGDIDGVPSDFADGVDDDTTYSPGNQLNLVGDTFDVVEGPGSGLDADLIDGLDSNAFAPNFTVGDGLDLVGGELSVDPSEFNGYTPMLVEYDANVQASTVGVWHEIDHVSFAAPASGIVMIITHGSIQCSSGCTASDKGTVYVGVDKDTSPDRQYEHEFTRTGIRQPMIAFDFVSVSEGAMYNFYVMMKPGTSDTFNAAYVKVACVFIPIWM